MAKRCYAIGGRINFNENTVSLCHGIDIGDKVIWSYDSGIDFTPRYYLEKMDELNRLNQEEHPECEGCSNLIEGEALKTKLEIITINPMNFCQNRCVYCANFQGEIRELYNPLPIIKEFIEAGLVADNCLFDWGGGEPTLSNYFEETFLYLLNSGYMQRVNTNTIKLNRVLLNNLDKNLVSLRISLDAGNEKTFLATKGRNLFDQVISNLEQYKKRTENIVLKYVITNTNSDKESIKDFVKLAVSMNIRTICIDTDMYSFGWNEYNGVLRFTEEELEAAHLLRELAHREGLNVQIGYVWTAQDNSVPSRDFNCIRDIKELNESSEVYSIPEQLLPLHIEKLEVYTNGIMPTVLASFETLLACMGGKKIILYGAGNNGRQLLQCLREFEMDIYAVCDKHKVGEYIDKFLIKSIDEICNIMDDNTCVIITPNMVKDIVIEFNKANYVFLKDKLYYIDSFRYSRKVLEEIKCGC